MWTLWPYHPGALLAGPNKQNQAQILKKCVFYSYKSLKSPNAWLWCPRSHLPKLWNSWLLCQEFKVGPILTHIENVFNFRKFSLLLHMFEKSESMIMMSKKPFSKIVKLIDPGSEFQALACDQYEHILKMYIFLKLFFLLLYIWEKLNSWLWCHEPST